MSAPENIIPFGGREKLFDSSSNHQIMDGLEPAGACEVFTEPIVDKTEARSVAAQLLGLDLAFVKTRDTGGCWITATVPGGEQYHWRGATWFGALEAVHKFLVERVSSNEQPPEEGDEEPVES